MIVVHVARLTVSVGRELVVMLMCRHRLDSWRAFEDMACRAGAAAVFVVRCLALYDAVSRRRVRRVLLVGTMRRRGGRLLSIMVLHGSIGLLVMVTTVRVVPWL
jgi:hypothetical protein